MKFRNLLNVFADGRTVILSTHIIGDIEETCRNLAIIKKGALAYAGNVQDLKSKTEGMVWEVECSRKELEEIKRLEKKIEILSQVSKNDNFKLRILSEDIPFDGAILVESKIEDSYIRLMQV